MMRQKLIQPCQMKVTNRIVTNFFPSSQSKRLAPVIAPSNKSQTLPEQDLLADYPTCPKEYDGNILAQNTFDAMRSIFQQHHHTYDKGCQKTWLANVTKHLGTSPADVSLSRHPLYRQAMKKPNWAHLVLLRQMFGHRALMNSKVFRILQQTFPKSNLDANQYNEDSVDGSLIQPAKTTNKVSTTKSASRKNRDTSSVPSKDTGAAKIKAGSACNKPKKPMPPPLHTEISSSDKQPSEHWLSRITPKILRPTVVPPFGGVGNHTSSRQARVQLQGAHQADLGEKPLSTAGLPDIERILDDIKGSISDFKAEYGTKFEKEVEYRKFWSAVARSRDRDIQSLQEQVAIIQTNFEEFKNSASKEVATELLMEGHGVLAKVKECRLVLYQPYTVFSRDW